MISTSIHLISGHVTRRKQIPTVAGTMKPTREVKDKKPWKDSKTSSKCIGNGPQEECGTCG